MPPALFALVILEIGSHFLPRLIWIAILLFYPDIGGLTGARQLISVEMEISQSPIPAWNHNPPSQHGTTILPHFSFYPF
jgi:hypothetical protein